MCHSSQHRGPHCPHSQTLREGQVLTPGHTALEKGLGPLPVSMAVVDFMLPAPSRGRGLGAGGLTPCPGGREDSRCQGACWAS